MTPLDFEGERDDATTSFERADPRRAAIWREAWDTWRVALPDGEEVHTARLRTDHGRYEGECDCAGFEHHTGACAHLCALRKATTVDYPDMDGEPVRVFDVEHVADDRASNHVERIMADGGRRLRGEWR
ncbi:hypothetical protein [Halomarina oriensis]|uniref:SWIM-type domain-containing protein n=1 Tax=Halomarina oriensis TaxID=671145 RepID=A0A6B0GR68_9EURY|nr:hypothetical protein [Halomarina oriensis]MWG34168.1 hypothetical protein [Halomarina oriensis]